MDIFRKRFPPAQDIVLVFAVCAFPIYGWSIFRFLEKMPGWLYHVNMWGVIGIFAYTQVFALFESGIVLLFLLLLAAIVPKRFVRAKFVAVGSMVVIVSSFWAVLAQYNDQIFRLLSAKALLPWGGGVPCVDGGILLSSPEVRECGEVYELSS